MNATSGRQSGPWKLRYASHVGYATPVPLYAQSVGSNDLAAHVRFAADLGFAGVQFARARNHSPQEQEQFGRAIEQAGLETGCMIYAGGTRMRDPLWITTDADSRSAMMQEIDAAFEAAKRIHSRYIAVLSGTDPRQPRSFQLAAFVENLKWAGERAAREDIVLMLELMSRRSIPDAILQHIGDAHAVVKAVDNLAVKLIYDTSHIQIMDGDLIENLRTVWDSIALVQIADNPNRLEPGTGEINFPNLLGALYRGGFTGLVELEHMWSEPTRACEERGIAWLRQADAALA